MVKLGLVMDRAANGRASRSRLAKPAIGTEVSRTGRQMRAMGAAHARMLNPKAAAMAGLTL